MPIIEVDHVTKEYRLGQLHSLNQSLRNLWARARGLTPATRSRFKALDDVAFSAEAGEVIGIIGTNGAGKSTLLKLLAGITAPTSGAIKVGGKIAPLIEVGAGLVGDMTGRENVFVNGAILGISRSELSKKLDSIIEFAELEEFIDTPVKRYSSGMSIRLGFAIATSVDADILIVDEVLAVGDLAFQRKCFDRMEEMIKREGRTVLLVSHNIRQVERMCSRVILLDHGRILMDGDPYEATNMFYDASNKKIQAHQMAAAKSKVESSGEAEVLAVDILDTDGNPTDEIQSAAPLRVRVRFHLACPLEKPEIVVGTHRTDFVYLTSGSTAVFDDRPDYPAGTHEVEYSIPSFPLVPGVYCIRFAILDKHRRTIYLGETLKTFSVASLPGEARQAVLRTLNLPTTWHLQGRVYEEATRPAERGSTLGFKG